ncbi:MAG: aminopeptidase P family protein [Anaerolineae bacterium]|nr:aminopeptidase P family protein [Phycisphaerae bacterium]
MLQIRQSRARQKRLLERVQSRGFDALVLSQPKHAYYVSAFQPHWAHECAIVIFADGRSVLISANSPAKEAAADEMQSFEANWHGTMRLEQPQALAEKIEPLLRSRNAKRIGIDSSPTSAQLAMRCDGQLESIDEDVWQLRRRKDADEIEIMRIAMRAVDAMYARARQIIEPGIDELHVFNELHAAAVEATGQPMAAVLGNDYACGSGGGPPRKDRRAQEGEIYILDVGPTYRMYFADACRAFAVDRKPTDAQLKAYEAIVSCFPIVESLAKPGARCKDIYQAVDDHLMSQRGTGMPHHLGHGIGLNPHEFPHLNPKWDDVLEEGEIFTAEPGQYGEELRGGIRIENAYLVTKTGVENLVKSPMELV